MKIIFYSIWALTLVTWAKSEVHTQEAIQEEMQSAQKEEKEDELRRITMRVRGLVCPFCVQGISKKLDGVDEIANYHVDLKSGIVSIDLKPQKDISNAQLIDIMEGNGISTSDEEISRNWSE